MWCTGAEHMASPGGKLSSSARLMRNGEMEHFLYVVR